jgi:hypothetical protein
MIQCVGKLVYNPPRGKMKVNPWWLVLDIEPELTRYYRWWVERQYGIVLCKPAWDAHVTVVRGQEPEHKELWGKHADKEIVFSLQPGVRQSGDTTGWDRPDSYWFVDIFSSELSDIMVELGFPEKEKYHLTVGRTY